MLARAGHGDRTALDRLAELYWPPVYAFLRRKGLQPDEAADLTQEFFAEKILSSGFAGKADRQRGRFRSFLLRSVQNFRIDVETRHKPQPGAPVVVPRDLGTLATAEPRHDEDPAAAFDRMWATTLLNLALERTRDYLLSNGYGNQWTVLQERAIFPAIHGTERTPMDELARRLQVESERVPRLLFAARRRFQSTLRDVVLATVGDETDGEAELEHLRHYLGI